MRERWVQAVRRLDAETWWLLGLLVALAAVKLPYSAAWSFPGGYDGGFYTNLAMNLLAGEGLTTNVSLYHKGFSHFPHVDSIYPLWPLVYAAFGAVFPLFAVSVWLPTTLYFVALSGAFLWARRLAPGAFFPAWLPGFGAGHLAVLILGTHDGFFRHTSFPYTEALAYSLCFFGLWRAVPLLTRRAPRDGLELGLWLGAMIMARSQLVLVVAAAVGAGGVGLVLHAAERRRWVRFGLAAGVGIACWVVPYGVYLSQKSELFSPLNYILFSETPAGSVLSPFEPYVRPAGVAGTVANILHGFAKAYLPGEQSYVPMYYGFHLAVPAGLLAAALRAPAVWRDGGFRRALAWVRDPSRAPWVLVGLLAVLGFVSLHVLGKQLDKWYFHKRHNLTALFLFWGALVLMFRSRSRVAHVLAIVIVLGSVAYGAVHLVARAEDVLANRPAPQKSRVVKWLNAERARAGRPLVVVFNQPQVVVWQTPGVSYHEVNVKHTSLEDVITMFDTLGADYLVSPRGKRVRHRRPKEKFEAAFEAVPGGDLKQWKVFRRRSPPAPAGT